MSSNGEFRVDAKQATNLGLNSIGVTKYLLARIQKYAHAARDGESIEIKAILPDGNVVQVVNIIPITANHISLRGTVSGSGQQAEVIQHIDRIQLLIQVVSTTLPANESRRIGFHDEMGESVQ